MENQQQKQTKDKPHQCGQHGKGKGKKKQGQHGHSHNPEGTLHITNVTSIAIPSMSTIVQIGPSSLSQCTISATPTKEHTTRPYQSLNKALNFADHIGVKATIKTMKMLEQRMVNQYMYDPWSKFTNYLSDDKGLDIVDMSVASPLQEANIIHASPMKKDDSDKEYVNWPKLPYAQLPSYKPLN